MVTFKSGLSLAIEYAQLNPADPQPMMTTSEMAVR
jgi:hypothetical protein